MRWSKANAETCVRNAVEVIQRMEAKLSYTLTLFLQGVFSKERKFRH